MKLWQHRRVVNRLLLGGVGVAVATEFVEFAIDNPWFEFTTPDRADFSVRRVGGQAGKVLEGTDYSLSSTYFIRAKIDERELRKAFYAIDLAVVDHTAGVRSISKRELVALVSEQLKTTVLEAV